MKELKNIFGLFGFTIMMVWYAIRDSRDGWNVSEVSFWQDYVFAGTIYKRTESKDIFITNGAGV